MIFELKHIGKTIIELRVHHQHGTLIDDVTNLNGVVSSDLINNLRDILEELESHNNELES